MSKIKVRRVSSRPPRLLGVFALLLLIGVSSCNVTRTVTTTASSFTSGDTTTTIITKTIESYDATRKLH